jgi:PhnB protein
MAKKVNPIPESFHAITPQITASNARALIKFYEKGLGAETLYSMDGPDGEVMHANVRVGDSNLFVTETSPMAPSPTQANIYLYVKDVDQVFERAVKAGARVLAPVSDMFWGDRWGQIADPAGNIWQIATHVEDLSPDEMAKRMESAAPPK